MYGAIDKTEKSEVMMWKSCEHFLTTMQNLKSLGVETFGANK